MIVITIYPIVDEEKCIGCTLCEKKCTAQGTIKVIDGKASINRDECLGCFRCFDVCPNGAILPDLLPEPVTVKIDYSDIDPDAINAICKKAEFVPERIVCTCTQTTAAEIAAAILKGAKTAKEISLMTGLRSVCGIYCTMPLVKIMKAAGIDTSEIELENLHDVRISLDAVPDEVAEKYPEYHIREDQKLLKQDKLPFLPEML